MRLLPVLCLLLTFPCQIATEKPPHIIFFLVDDMGWHDIEYERPNGKPSYSDMHTPVLKEFTKNCLKLENFYTQPKCTPARAALMTARYPFHLGLQTHKVFTATKNNTLDLSLKLLPEYLRDLGYVNHMVGKWHLGHCNENATPIRRGFLDHYGTWGNLGDRFQLTTGKKGADGQLGWTWNNYWYSGAVGNYSTHAITSHAQLLLEDHFKNETTKNKKLFLYLPYLVPHKPTQAPDEYINDTKCNNINVTYTLKNGTVVENKRRTFCGMMAAMDEALGNITDTLRKLKVIDKCLIFFCSDNGGAIDAGASNFPFRGNKQSVYEGGTKVRAFMRFPRRKGETRVRGIYRGLMHIVDILPTLYAAAGGNSSDLPGDLDGKDLWKKLKRKDTNTREWMVYNIDTSRELAAIRFQNTTHNYKLIYSNATHGEVGYRYQDPRPHDLQISDPREERYTRRNNQAYFLYDLDANPIELPALPNNNVVEAQNNTAMFNMMLEKLESFLAEEKPVIKYGRLNKRSKEEKELTAVGGC